MPDAPSDGTIYGRVNGAWANVVPLAGGVMTGLLTLNADPTTGLGASTKQYVDKGFAGAGVIGCNAVGTNAIALTPHTAVYAPTAYTDTAPLFTWVQTLTTNGAVTINISGLGARNAYKPNGTPVGANDLIGGQIYQALYYSGLNVGAGGFIVYAAAATGRVTISDTAPASPAVGDLWWDSIGALLYIYFQDPTSTQWVNANNAAAGGGGGLVGFNSYSSSQTITIPATATRGLVEMWGATGGSGGIGNVTYESSSGSTGAGGYLRKLLTGLTAGSTLVYTQGAAGAAGTSAGTNGGNGGASTLAAGTQTITTLTANGSAGSLSPADGVLTAGTAGGTAANGDFNFTGRSGAAGIFDSTVWDFAIAPVGAMTMFSFGADGVHGRGSAGFNGNPGRAGGCNIWWYT
jgi:hypothetical protein